MVELDSPDELDELLEVDLLPELELVEDDEPFEDVSLPELDPDDEDPELDDDVPLDVASVVLDSGPVATPERQPPASNPATPSATIRVIAISSRYHHRRIRLVDEARDQRHRHDPGEHGHRWPRAGAPAGSCHWSS